MSEAIADVLKRARKLISDPLRWIKDDYAQDEFGNDVSVMSPKACAWCALGAILRVQGLSEWTRLTEPEKHFVKAAGTKRIGYFNDDPETTYADVLAAFDRAIALADAAP